MAVVGVLFCSLLVALHSHQRQSFTNEANAIARFRQARIDLAEGFTHITASGFAGSPFSSEQGNALLLQALRDFEDPEISEVSLQLSEVVADFRQGVNDFRQQMVDWTDSQTPDSRAMVELRVAFHRLMTLATRVDAESRSRLLTFSNRQHNIFLAVMIGAIGLLSAACFFVLHSGRSAESAHAAQVDAEENLRLSKAREKLSSDLLRAVAEGTTDAVFVKDQDGRYLFFNQAASQFVGKPIEEVIGRDDVELFDADSAAVIRSRDRSVMNSGLAQTEEEELTAAGVTRTYLATKAPYRDKEGNVVGVIGISRDITDRKLALAAISRSEELFREMANTVPAVIWMTDCNGATTFINEQWSAFTGQPVEEALGYGWLDIVHPDDRDKARQLWLAANQKQSGYQSEYRLAHAEGYHWAHSTARPRIGPTGDFLGYIGCVMDMEDHRKLEEQFRQSQKMEAFGQLAGGVAHDFNNLLTIILGYSDFALSRLQSGDPLRGDIEAIYGAGQRAASLTCQLLAFSRQTVIEPKILDLNEVVRDTESMLRRLIGEDIVLTSVLAPRLGRIKVDPGQLSQVLMNIAVNARDAMPKGGKLTVETAEVFLDEEYMNSHVEVQAGKYVLLAISDTGHGMTPEVRSRIFEPFFTTKGSGKGTGLGLATVFGIVKQSGGHVWVYSEPNKGTSFKIYLPLAEEKPGVTSENESVVTLNGTETVLLVEDEEAVRQLASLILQTRGYTVLVAGEGVESLKIASEHPGLIDLVLTDVVMPTMDGRDLTDQLRVLYPRMKVLFMSGYTDDAVVRHGILHEEVAFIQKPFSPLALAKKVREVLDQRSC